MYLKNLNVRKEYKLDSTLRFGLYFDYRNWEPKEEGKLHTFGKLRYTIDETQLKEIKKILGDSEPEVIIEQERFIKNG